MASTKNQSTLFTLKIFDLLAQEPIKGLSLQDVLLKVDATRSTTHRALKTLQEAGWIEQSKTGAHAVNWRVSPQLLKLAHRYRRCVVAEIDRLGAHYQDITGEELKHD
ncbi:helix-turn-helix domain-containing protein [Vibrio europaeus]|uniref:helix-turn-helix domain-containing protein n=1 Tax=Vibrio europaeus TaxID=300876 RepID=UPI00233F4128|nr:helix-turn-helix domain-containing protein [Vibrio europaeus]MDC5755210.1 helix-turn-helix domain-containing protein [Vibrio europaeus]MDC5775789.1 helix-turn-helix domain-containing protein [Vibrio europaeus]MDC5794927.1 helix-turn-helix domain-containing protein [Vibrio europaeus]MDC5799498.1 helix-turn-helix domain-containing protein [Vibrio europaeus]MDC5817206.1 helix-turn-helix domain-containing protein [Vibrio europaeus]